MKYFTRDQHDASNSTDSSTVAAAIEEFRRNAELYRHQFEALRPRLSAKTWKFFDTVSLHDATLLKMSVGDDLDGVLLNESRGAFVNKRRLSVLLDVLDSEGTRRYSLRYRQVRRIAFDYPSADPWYMRYGAPERNPIDDWIADELTAADDEFLRHEVLFSSGTTLLVEFVDVSIKGTKTA